MLLVGAVSLPLLVGAAAFALDTTMLALFNRQLQRAADSSAIAGAHALSQGMDVNGASNDDLDENDFPALSRTPEIAVGPSQGFQRTVRVRLTAQRALPFMSVFTSTPSTMRSPMSSA